MCPEQNSQPPLTGTIGLDANEANLGISLPSSFLTAASVSLSNPVRSTFTMYQQLKPLALSASKANPWPPVRHTEKTEFHGPRDVALPNPAPPCATMVDLLVMPQVPSGAEPLFLPPNLFAPSLPSGLSSVSPFQTPSQPTSRNSSPFGPNHSLSAYLGSSFFLTPFDLTRF